MSKRKNSDSTPAKGTVFFFPGNSLPPLTHSIFENFVFFFPQKKYKMFFFSRKSLKATHSPGAQISTKKGQKHVFFVIFSHLGCFFFPTFFCFFFPRKSLHPTHSLNFGRPEKKTAVEKKTQFSLTQSIFAQNVQKTNYSGEIKKYGTFGQPLCKREF